MHRNNALLLTLAVLTASSAHATQFTRWENRRESDGAFRLIPELTFLSTSSNYDTTGASSAPAGLDYSKTLMDLNLIYGLTARATAFARLSLANVSYETSSLRGSGSGLGDQALGFNYRLMESSGGTAAGGYPLRRTTLDAQAQIEFPLYDKAAARRNNPQDPLLGDGTFDVTFGPFLTHPLNQGAGNRWFFVGGVAAMIRNSGYSMAVPYQLALASQPEDKGLFGRVGIYGLQSLSSDPQRSIGLDPGANTKDAGDSLIVNALNSSYTSARAQLGYQFSATKQLYLGYQKTFRGKSTADLTAISLGAQFRFGSGTTSPSAHPSRASSEGGRRSEKLSYDLEGTVIQTNDRMNLVKMNKGSSDGLAQGQVIDIYRPGPDGRSGDLIARGVVQSVRSGEAVVQIRQYAKQVVIQNGFAAKRLSR